MGAGEGEFWYDYYGHGLASQAQAKIVMQLQITKLFVKLCLLDKDIVFGNKTGSVIDKHVFMLISREDCSCHHQLVGWLVVLGLMAL